VGFAAVAAESPAMRTLIAALERTAPTDAPVLLQGEPGTGKHLLARSIHETSPRGRGPFVLFDCAAAIPASVEVDLFGQERPAAGNGPAKIGAVESTDGGTLVLDEIGDLPLDVQSKVARLIETKEYRKVGAAKPSRTDVRIVAISGRDLKRDAERGKVKDELIARLAPVVVPPLRARREDIRSIALTLLRYASETEPSVEPLTLSDESAAALTAHDWPGNVRELRGVIDRAAQRARAAGTREIRPFGLGGGQEPYVFEPGRTYRETRTGFETEFERRYVKWLLARHRGNISAAARDVQMDRKYLYDLAKKHGMRGKDDRSPR
jgi:DNA-binding NtrC family response regulator